MSIGFVSCTLYAIPNLVYYFLPHAWKVIGFFQPVEGLLKALVSMRRCVVDFFDEFVPQDSGYVHLLEVPDQTFVIDKNVGILVLAFAEFFRYYVVLVFSSYTLLVFLVGNH